MRPSRGYALVAAAVLIVLAVSLAVLRADDEESPDATPTTTSETTTSDTTTSSTTTSSTTTSKTTTSKTTTSGATTAAPAETAPSPSTEAATTEKATTSATTAATEPEEPPATTEAAPAETSGSSVTTPTSPSPYALGPTRRCLQGAGFAVSTIRSTDPRLRALGDLAQRTSLEARRAGQTLGLAFGDTRLLLSLLRVPNDPYKLEVRRNALLMYRPAARREAALLRGCLRS